VGGQTICDCEKPEKEAGRGSEAGDREKREIGGGGGGGGVDGKRGGGRVGKREERGARTGSGDSEERSAMAFDEALREKLRCCQVLVLHRRGSEHLRTERAKKAKGVDRERDTGVDAEIDMDVDTEIGVPGNGQTGDGFRVERDRAEYLDLDLDWDAEQKPYQSFSSDDLLYRQGRSVVCAVRVVTAPFT